MYLKVTGVAWCPADLGCVATCGDDPALRVWSICRDSSDGTSDRRPRPPRRMLQVPAPYLTESMPYILNMIAAPATKKSNTTAGMRLSMHHFDLKCHLGASMTIFCKELLDSPHIPGSDGLPALSIHAMSHSVLDLPQRSIRACHRQ